MMRHPENGGRIIQLKQTMELHKSGGWIPSRRLVGLVADWLKPPRGNPIEDRRYIGNVEAAVGACHSQNCVLAYMKGQEIVGLAFITVASKLPKLSELAVNPDHRGQGIGAALVKEAIRRFPSIEAAIQDEGLIQWYADLGMTYSRQIEPHELGTGLVPWTEWTVATVPVDKVRKVTHQIAPRTAPMLSLTLALEQVAKYIGKKRRDDAYMLMCKQLGVPKKQAKLTLKLTVPKVMKGLTADMAEMSEALRTSAQRLAQYPGYINKVNTSHIENAVAGIEALMFGTPKQGKTGGAA